MNKIITTLEVRESQRGTPNKVEKPREVIGTVVFNEIQYPSSRKGYKTKVINDSTADLEIKKPATDTIRFKF